MGTGGEYATLSSGDGVNGDKLSENIDATTSKKKHAAAQGGTMMSAVPTKRHDPEV